MSAAPTFCVTCRKPAATAVRRGMCRACYLRHWRGTELPDDARCVGCGEKRRLVLRWTKAGDERAVTCQNCGFVADKARPRAVTVDELTFLLRRERRRGRERRRNYVIDVDASERRRRARRKRRA